MPPASKLASDFEAFDPGIIYIQLNRQRLRSNEPLFHYLCLTEAMIKTDFHTHTYFCDGVSSPEEMVLAAIDKGLTAIGFSGHAYTSFDTEWCMSLENTEKYFDEIDRLKKIYIDRIKIYHGLEWDLYSDGSRDRAEYLIGSVHYIERNGVRRTVDESAESLTRLVKDMYDGDFYACAGDYYKGVGSVLEKTGADIVGHFDLITKFNEGGRLFDTGNERYVRAWQEAADRLLPYNKPFEINTGAISRGYRTKPYPAADIIDYIGERGGGFILSSDSHSTKTLLFEFSECEKYIKNKGYRLLDNPFEM